MRIPKCDSVVWKISTDISAEHQYLSTAQYHRRITQHYGIAVKESAQPLLLVCSDRVLNMAHQREPCSQCRPQITC